MTGRVQNGVRKALCVIEGDVPRRLNEIEIIQSADVTERVPCDVAKVNADDRLAKNGCAEVEHVPFTRLVVTAAVPSRELQLPSQTKSPGRAATALCWIGMSVGLPSKTLPE